MFSVTTPEGHVMLVPNCQRPTKVLLNKRLVVVPCGKCYQCRRKLVRIRQGLVASEQAHPYFPEDVLPSRNHWFTHTWAKCPQTVPVPHRLGWIQVGTGSGSRTAKWAGPFPKDFLREHCIRWDKSQRELVHEQNNRVVSDSTRALIHREYFRSVLHWTDDQIQSWIDGTYAAADTVSMHEVQKFTKRMREAVYREIGRRPRYVVATEYGDENFRPHFHIAWFGLPQEFATLSHDLWEGYQGENGSLGGMVEPTRTACMLYSESVMRDKAATYQAKDLVKNREHRSFAATPSLYATEVPKVRGSTRPAIGAKAYENWRDGWIAKVLDRAAVDPIPEDCGDDRELFAVMLIREHYTVHHVTIPGRDGHETFPTSDTWRNQLRADLGISDQLWALASDIAIARRAQMTNVLDTPEKFGGAKELHEQFISDRKELQRQAEERLAQAIKRKRESRARRLAARSV